MKERRKRLLLLLGELLGVLGSLGIGLLLPLSLLGIRELTPLGTQELSNLTEGGIGVLGNGGGTGVGGEHHEGVGSLGADLLLLLGLGRRSLGLGLLHALHWGGGLRCVDLSLLAFWR